MSLYFMIISSHLISSHLNLRFLWVFRPRKHSAGVDGCVVMEFVSTVDV
jgi:hypothetical protein